MMNFLNKEIKAVIFDLDGTLIDSTSVWKKIDSQFFKKRGMEIPKTYTDDIAHVGLKEAAIITKEKYHIKESIEEIIQEWQQSSYDEYAYNIQLKQGVCEYLAFLKQNNIKLAIATASPKKLYEPCLKRLKIYHYFDYIASVEDVKKGKDSIELYHFVSNKLQILPENTLVFEDISVGLKTAFTNKYITIAVFDENSIKDDKEKRKYSYLYINNFLELLKK